MATRFFYSAVLLVISIAIAHAETRIIGVDISRGQDSKPRVSIWSEKKEKQRNVSVNEAADLLRKTLGSGSTVYVGIIVRDRVPSSEYLAIVKAISENVWLELAFVDASGPNFIKDNIRKKIGSPSPP